MQITPQILSIPPYLSTTWDNISVLKPESLGEIFSLTVILKNGDRVTVPSLTKSEISSIFEAHAKSVATLPQKQGGFIASINEPLHHNPEQSDLPEIPPEVLGKISLLTKAFNLEGTSSFEELAQTNCNCIYCQMKRALTPTEEKIDDLDLVFRDWEIKELSNNLYTVTNPLNLNEHYNVFLGEPIGCTCGHKNCEHIKAVLQS